MHVSRFAYLHRLSVLSYARSPLLRTVRRSAPSLPSAMAAANPYSNWSQEQLLARITDLERQLRDVNVGLRHEVVDPYESCRERQDSTELGDATSSSSKQPNKPAKSFDPSRYHTRLIALKFAYLGADYNGFEYSKGNYTPLPTIEEELWKALVKTRLVFPEPGGDDRIKKSDAAGNTGAGFGADTDWQRVDWEACEYSKCGRTDRGVSAFGQVIGVRVRSARRKIRDIAQLQGDLSHSVNAVAAKETQSGSGGGVVDTLQGTSVQEKSAPEAPFDSVRDELPYISLLNKVLPPTIRILAWCPNPPPNFSARFSCKERLYKYFFTNPAFLPTPFSASESHGPPKSLPDGWLDLQAMQAAAENLVGLHDFRNFCKADPTKQITNFNRRITYAGIERISSNDVPAFLTRNLPAVAEAQHRASTQPGLYAFVVKGSAFLWHQVRCMVAVLFLVGQGLERPDVVRDMLDVSTNPRKPQYAMAGDAPLVLWDCMFSTTAGKFSDVEKATRSESWDRGTGPDELEWLYAGEETTDRAQDALLKKYDRSGIMEDLWRVWRAANITEVLAGQLLDLVACSGPQQTVEEPLRSNPWMEKKLADAARNPKIFQGEDSALGRGKYVTLMKREKMETIEVINAKWLARKGRIARVAGDGEDKL